MRHRPVGIGVQGLADTFILLGMPFDSLEVIVENQEHPFDFCYLNGCDLRSVFLFLQAQQLNKDIFETIYYHALKASSELAEKEGTYETYNGSPVSKVGI